MAHSTGPLAEYRGAADHLQDELARLDLLIHRAALRRRGAVSKRRRHGNEIAHLLTMDIAPPALPRRTHRALRRLDAAITAWDQRVAERREATMHLGLATPLQRLERAFGLTAGQSRCLVACLAPEMDGKYGRLFQFLDGDGLLRVPTPDLLAALLEPVVARSHTRQALGAGGTLLAHRLLEAEDTPGAGRILRVDARIAAFLQGDAAPDSRLAHAVRCWHPAAPDMLPPGLDRHIRLFVSSYLGRRVSEQRSVVIQATGPRGCGRRALAEAAAHELGTPLVYADLSRLEAGARAEVFPLLAREALLQPGVLCVRGFDTLLGSDPHVVSAREVFLDALCELSQLTFLLGSRAWRLDREDRDVSCIHVDVGSQSDRLDDDRWEVELRAAGGFESGGADTLASTFRFTRREIREAVSCARDLALWRSPAERRLDEDTLYDACRTYATPANHRLAKRIEPRQTWADLVLPDTAERQLREICSRARLMSRVMSDWGFGRRLSLGKGLAALFTGTPGTGKTLAAEVLAGELGLDLYKIDLSQVVDKYIGETEKNLDRVFRAAERGSAVLLFDEADSLFGKRSEVRDARDRYANLEVSYLLQKMEEYEGISILTTNLRKHLDDAFERRLQFIVEFPFPDTEARERIWRVIFPGETPLAEDVRFAVLAERIRMAGGGIKNIALAAAFHGAERGGPIGMSDVIRAADSEHRKLGLSWQPPTASSLEVASA